MSAELASLVDLIANQVRVIGELCLSKDAVVPSVDDANALTPTVMKQPGFIQAADLAIAAATRLIATLRDPDITLHKSASGMYGSALLNIVVEANITEALREAGPRGLHVRELAPKVGMDPVKLGRVLRYLCALHYVYREVEPDVFTNNRVSIGLDTGKSFDGVKDRSSSRYAHSRGCAAFIAHTTDECFKGAVHLPDSLLDPKTAYSQDQNKTATMKAFGFDGTWFEWLDQPEQKDRLDRYHEAMIGTNALFPKENILEQFQWDTLTEGSIVVDIGGLGGSTLPLARSFPSLQFVVQDGPVVMADAEKYWKNVYPEALETGLVKLQTHDFFEPQPIEDAAVFLLRSTLHVWPALKTAQILQQLRAAATEDTKLVIVEQVTPYSCAIEGDIASPNVPEALRGNMAARHGLPYITDIRMMNLLNSKERTIGQWATLTKACGWNIEAIHPGSVHSIICSPAY